MLPFRMSARTWTAALFRLRAGLPRSQCKELVARLRRAGCDVYYDAEQPDKSRAAVPQAIRDSDAVLFFLSGPGKTQREQKVLGDRQASADGGGPSRPPPPEFPYRFRPVPKFGAKGYQLPTPAAAAAPREEAEEAVPSSARSGASAGSQESVLSRSIAAQE